MDYIRSLNDLRMLVTDRDQAHARLREASLGDIPDLLRQCCGYEMPPAYLATYQTAIVDQDWATVRGVLARAGDALHRSVVRRSLAEQARLGMCEILMAICGDCAAALGVADMLAQCQRRA